jgi:hypothetical protein
MREDIKKENRDIIKILARMRDRVKGPLLRSPATNALKTANEFREKYRYPMVE